MTELNPQDIELIERYLDKLLDEDTQTAFNERMAQDRDFKEAVASYEEAVLAINLAESDEIRAILKQEQAKLEGAKVVSIDKNKPKTPFLLMGGLVAAGIAALVLGGYWFLLKPKTMALSPLVASYFQPYPALGILKGDETRDVTQEALRTYAVNDFKKAIPLLQQGFQLKKDSLLLFYKGISYLGNGQVAEAQPILSALQTSEVVDSETVQWYLALAYIELGQKQNALILLKKLADTEGGYKTQAAEILEKIKF